MSKRELRFSSELRAEAGDEMAVGGYAALYNHESKDLGGFRELIAPGAFNRSLQAQADVKALVNHDASQLLGRVKNNTLTLSQDERGLKWRAVLNKDSQAHRDLYASVKRGDMDECSFAFTVPAGGQTWTEAKDDSGEYYAKRTLTDVELLDVSVVTYPAYGGTNAGVRSLFPDGDVAEIRSAVDAAKAKGAMEKRNREDSIEAQYWAAREAMNAALAAQFQTDNGSRKYYLVETYADHIIAVGYDKDYNEQYVSIPYSKNADGAYTFGEPKAVELDWQPSERSKQATAEYRTALKAAAEKRDADNGESYEEAIREVQAALDKKYPGKEGGWGGQYYTLETHDDYVIVCEWETGKYFKITYHEDETNGEANETFLFGEPEEVVQEYVPADERASKRLAEYRSAKAKHEHRAHSMEHREGADGDCMDPECACQNRDVDPEDVFDDDDESDENETDEDRAKRAERKTARVAEMRKKSEKVRTKSVGGKNLPASKFAYVGDPERTETWKLPIHDASHVRNALARFNQTEGIPAAEKAGVWRKIVAAAEKFGIHVSDEDSSRALTGTPMDELEKAQVLAALAAKEAAEAE